MSEEHAFLWAKQHPEHVAWMREAVLWKHFGYIPLEELSLDQVNFMLYIINQQERKMKKEDKMSHLRKLALEVR